jgi:hypothetical protein
MMEKPIFDFTLLNPANNSPGSFVYHLEELQEELSKPELSKPRLMLKLKKSNDLLRQALERGVPSQLFSEFWLEGELCILFADTNLGKSILAVELADSLSAGVPIPGFNLEGAPRTVLYLDFELSDIQFAARYSENYTNPYHFSDRFFRAELDEDFTLEEGETFEQQLFVFLESVLDSTKASVLIVDNITYLRSETEKASHALPLMKELKALKRKYNLSILALAHTPKRDLSKPVTQNDLQGSKMLINFCDSAFAIGQSYQEKSLRYLKQIKARSTEMIYDEKHVCICQIVKHVNKLMMEKIDYGKEQVHLRRPSEQAQAEEPTVRQIKKLKEAGRSNREIARALGISEGGVRYWLKKEEE